MVLISALRAVVALAFLLFLPGYAWSLVLYPRGEVGMLERATYSLALSVAILSPAFFLANLLLGIPINLPGSLAVVAFCTLLPLAHLWFRARGLYRWLKAAITRNRRESR